MSHPAETPYEIRLLHVDDEDFQLEALVGFLGLIDPLIHVVSVSSPSEALRLLEHENFDCVVTDFKMPEMTGIELSKRIRHKMKLPLILYTGQGSEEVAEAAFNAGVNDYIKKEMDPRHYHVLAKKIRDAVEKNRIEELYGRVVEDSREAIAIIVSDKIAYVNAALVALFGEKKPSDLVGRKFLDFFQPQDREIVEKNFAKNIIDGDSKYYQAVLRLRNGKKISSEISVSIFDYNGTKAVLNFIRDITYRKKLEEEIRSSEERFRTLVNMNPDGIALLNLKGEVTWVNPMFSRILGFTEKEIIGKFFFSLGVIQTSQYVKNMEIFRNLSHGEYVPPYEFQWIRKDNERVLGEAHFSLVNLEADEKEIMVITRDVTQQNKIKEELEIYSKKLEKLVQEKTTRLVDSEKMIAAGKLTTLLANDIREPLLTIKNAVNAMRVDPYKKQTGLETINQALQFSITMLDDLRTKTRDNPLKLGEVNIKSLIIEAIDESPIPPTVIVKIDVGNDRIVVDIQQIKRVIMNLIQNANDAMNGRGLITLSTTLKDNVLTIKVEDNGCGIKFENIKNLFKPFFTTKPDGLGLGLSYCKKVVEMHRGQIIWTLSLAKELSFISRSL
jgi:PAS domain S-box-containing protein